LKEQEYYLIGEVSKLCNIPIKTLRFYDEIGLLKPEQVNKENMYRYYSKKQLLLITIIKELKEADFSLDEIKKLIDRNNLEDLKSGLENKMSAVTRKIDELQYMKKRMEVYIDGINTMQELSENACRNDKSGVSSRIEVQNIPLIPVAFTRYCCPSNPDAFTLRYSELQSVIEKHELIRIGPRMAIFYDHYTNFDYSNADIEVCTQITSYNKNNNVIRQYGGFYAAVTTYKGNYKQMPEQYTKMLSWINLNGYEYVGPATEKYIIDAGSTSDENNFVTELILPVKKL
jgi:DNA-binding transcriptional MerR regulator/effector-binding domain-containing protein